jgi:hypothetical protein
MNYTDLKAAVLSYLHRPTLAADLPTFISRAESMIFRELDIADSEISATIVAVGGLLAIPPECSRVTRVTADYASAERDIGYGTSRIRSNNETAPAMGFSQEGTNLRLTDGAATGTYKLYYIPSTTPLSDSVPSNWVLVNAEDLYTYAACLEGARHVRNYGEVDRLAALVGPLLASVRGKMERRAMPSKGPIRSRGRW